MVFCVGIMVLILDGSLEHVAYVCKENKVNSVDTAFDVKKCFKQIKLTISLHTCAPCSVGYHLIGSPWQR